MPPRAPRRPRSGWLAVLAVGAIALLAASPSHVGLAAPSLSPARWGAGALAAPPEGPSSPRTLLRGRGGEAMEMPSVVKLRHPLRKRPQDADEDTVLTEGVSILYAGNTYGEALKTQRGFCKLVLKNLGIGKWSGREVESFGAWLRAQGVSELQEPDLSRAELRKRVLLRAKIPRKPDLSPAKIPRKPDLSPAKIKKPRVSRSREVGHACLPQELALWRKLHCSYVPKENAQSRPLPPRQEVKLPRGLKTQAARLERKKRQRVMDRKHANE